MDLVTEGPNWTIPAGAYEDKQAEVWDLVNKCPEIESY